MPNCYVLFSQWNENDTAVFGLPFLESFVTLLDYEKSMISFAVNSQAAPGVMAVHKMNGLDIGLIVSGSVLVLVAVGGIVYWCKKSKKSAE